MVNINSETAMVDYPFSCCGSRLLPVGTELPGSTLTKEKSKKKKRKREEKVQTQLDIVNAPWSGVCSYKF